MSGSLSSTFLSGSGLLSLGAIPNTSLNFEPENARLSLTGMAGKHQEVAGCHVGGPFLDCVQNESIQIGTDSSA